MSKLRKEQRREAMPITSAFWDAVIAEFGEPPEWFKAQENGQQIDWRKNETTRD